MSFATPPLADTIAAIQTDVSTRVPGANMATPRSVLVALARAQAGAVDGLYGFIASVASNIPYDTADETLLRRWAAMWGVPAKLPTAATGQVGFTGSAGAVVPAATALPARADGVQYALAADVVLDPTGAGTGTVTCTSVGAVTNCAAGTALSLASPVAGVSSTVTVGVDGLGGGADIESPQSLLARLLDRIQQTPMGGARTDYVRWAREVPGVTRAWVLPQWMGPGTVGVTFMMDGRVDPIPTAADVAVVESYVEALRPVAATTYYLAPSPVPLNPSIRLSPDGLAGRAAVTARLGAMLAKQAVPGGTVNLSQMHQAISSASGFNDYTLVSPVANVAVLPGQIVTLGTPSWA